MNPVPYDLIIACKIGLKCGFSTPVILSGHDDALISEIISKLKFDSPIQKIPDATESQMNEFWGSLLDLSNT